MRLTMSLRKELLRSIMEDVPTIDYNEKARGIIQEHYLTRLPPKVKDLLKDDTLSKHLTKTLIYTPSGLSSVWVLGDFEHELGGSVRTSLETIIKNKEYQDEKLRDVKYQIKATLASVTTTQKLVELYPQFAKYVPEEPKKTANLPMVTDVISSLSKVGWPK